MRKVALAVAALTGAALTTNAAMLKINDQAFANFGIKMQIYGQSLEDATSYTDNNNNYHSEDAIDFTIQNARVYFSGQLNSIVQFGANLDFTVTGANTSHEGTSTTKVRDAFINFHFMNELNVMAGYYRVPFSRATLVDRYNTIFMPQDGRTANAYKNQILPDLSVGNAVLSLTADSVMGAPTLGNAVSIAGLTDESDFARDAGVTIWGDVLNGMVKYYVGVYDGFGDHNAAEVVNGGGKDNLGYAIRLEFTPTMLGFQAEKGYLHKETYLGKKNVLTIGISYAASKLDLGSLNADTDRLGGLPNNLQPSNSYTFKSWAMDLNYEQKFGVFVPKFEVGYVQTDGDDLPLAQLNATRDGLNFVGTLDKVKTYYVTLGVLFDQQLWLGKLGAYIKYQKTKVELNNVPAGVARLIGGSDIEPEVWTVAIPYYLADQNAKIVLQWNHYDYDVNGFDPRLEGTNNSDDTNDDITLAFQVQF